MSQIKSITLKEDYKLEALLDNGSSITLNLKPRLGTVRFGLLADPEFFSRATTDGSFIRWGDRVVISVNELEEVAFILIGSECGQLEQSQKSGGKSHFGLFENPIISSAF